MICKKNLFSVLLVLILSWSNLGLANNRALVHPVQSNWGMVSTQDEYATQVGVDILKNGGNAIDAAVAIGYAMAVTHPQAGNLAGGGFMLIYDNKTQQAYALDYREKAPLAAHRDMFLDEQGNVVKQASRFSALSVGVPGTVAGLEAARQRFGSMALKNLIQPAIKLAKKGFVIKPGLARAIKRSESYLKPHTATAELLFKGDDYLEPGDVLLQSDLAYCLTQIKKYGTAGFYRGDIAQRIVEFIQSSGGIITLEDLYRYEPKWREPVIGTYKGNQIISMPPPSSGGIALIETLNILEALPLENMAHNSAEYIHLIAEALKFTYRDRAAYLGDTDFVDVPLKQLVSKQYAQQLAKSITDNQVLTVEALDPKKETSYFESSDTTHFVVADKYGNVVSNTYTLNFSFGNGMMVPGLGLLLNNEMDDFSAKPGVPNAYGLIGNEKNSIQPQKRMLSSMTPTIVFKDESPYIVTGSPGGSRIITTTLQVILNVLDHNMNIAEAVSAPRFHHQWTPDTLYVEKGFSVDTLQLLNKKGHQITPHASMGSAQSILVDGKIFYGTADTRKQDALANGI